MTALRVTSAPVPAVVGIASHGNALPVGAKVQGPAIFNQMDTTTVIEPGDVATVDEFGNLIVEIT